MNQERPLKPWEKLTRSQSVNPQSLSTQIATNANKDDMQMNQEVRLEQERQIGGQNAGAMNQISSVNNTNSNNNGNNTTGNTQQSLSNNPQGSNSYNSYSSYGSPYGMGSSLYGGSGYGSSYSPYSSYGGGYGSSLYGGGMYGGGYGGGMYGRMGGYMGGRMGMNMNDPNNPNGPGFIQNSLHYLFNMQDVVMAMGEIQRTIEHNYDQMRNLFESFIRIIKRTGGALQKFKTFLIQWIIKLLNLIKQFFIDKYRFMQSSRDPNRTQEQLSLSQKLMKIILTILIFSFFPIIYKFLTVKTTQTQLERIYLKN